MRKGLLSIMLILLAATLSIAASQIVINEIMYNSKGTDVEFIEIYNNSGQTMSLNGWYLLDDNDTHSPCQLVGNLEAGAYLVIAADLTTFGAIYPDVNNVNPNVFNPNGTGWALGNNGDIVRLFQNNATLHNSVAYETGGDWPGASDGNGPSLELLHPGLDNSLPSSWDPSAIDRGTPGKINSVYTTNVGPVCKDGERDIPLPKSNQVVKVTVIAYDLEGLEKVELMVNDGSGYVAIPMHDNGTNGDNVAGDSLFTAIIPQKTSNTLVKYYAVATDLIGQQDTWPNRAPVEYHAYTVDYIPPALKITEVLAINQTINQDEAGEYDDWFEIHNEGNTTVNLKDMFVSDLLNSPQVFMLPDYSLAPGAYAIIWADNDVEQGPLHVNFQLSSQGESVALFETVDHGNVLIHGWKYGRMSTDISMGFKTLNATAPDYLAVPTPRQSNESSPYFSAVCINEFQSTSDFGGPDDWIEIYNRGTEPFNLSRCFLSDERDNNTKWRFPNDTILQPGHFLVIYEDVLGFGLSSEGIDVIMLSAADSTVGLDFYDFGPQRADHSEGRSPDGQSIWTQFKPPTLGKPNGGGSKVETDFIAQGFELYQNYPNPFNPSTNISFNLPEQSYVSLAIYDILGHKIETIVSKKLPAGKHIFEWNGQHYPSGVYFYSFVSGSTQLVGKMQLIK